MARTAADPRRLVGGQVVHHHHVPRPLAFSTLTRLLRAAAERTGRSSRVARYNGALYSGVGADG